MLKQTSLGKFGFTKIVTKKDGTAELCNVSSVQMDSNEIHTCNHSKLKFRNPGALSTHTTCKHGIVPVVKTIISSTISNTVIHIDNNGNIPELQPNLSHTSISVNSKETKRKNTEDKHSYLKKKRLSYPAKFKMQVIEDQENGLKPNELVEKYSNFRLDESKISRWMKKKTDILKAAAGEHKNLLKIRPSVKYNKLFDELRLIFDDAH